MNLREFQAFGRSDKALDALRTEAQAAIVRSWAGWAARVMLQSLVDEGRAALVALEQHAAALRVEAGQAQAAVRRVLGGV